MVQRMRGRRAVARRAAWLDDHPLCCKCEAQNRIVAATVVDHVVALTNGGPDDESNFQSLCSDCHDLKTADDLGHRRRAGAALDGEPLDPNHHWNTEPGDAGRGSGKG